MKELLKERVLLSNLLQEYGSLLTESQKDIFASYYNYDLSLSEIADNKKISRSAVEDSLSKTSHKLLEYESKLHLLKKKDELSKLLEEAKTRDDYTKLGEFINGL